MKDYNLLIYYTDTQITEIIEIYRIIIIQNGSLTTQQQSSLHMTILSIVKIWQIFVNFCVINIFEERVATDGKKHEKMQTVFEYSNKNVSF